MKSTDNIASRPDRSVASFAQLLTTIQKRCCGKPGIALVIAGSLLIPLVVGALATSARQALSELPEGIGVEWLSAVPDVSIGNAQTAVLLQRHTYAPGAELELPYVGPVILYVESGTLALEDVGNDVSVNYPAKIVEQPLTGQQQAKRQKSEALLAGDQAEVGSGGTVFASSGQIGPTRNAGDDPLVVTVVMLVSEFQATPSASEPVENPPVP